WSTSARAPSTARSTTAPTHNGLKRRSIEAQLTHTSTQLPASLWRPAHAPAGRNAAARGPPWILGDLLGRILGAGLSWEGLWGRSVGKVSGEGLGGGSGGESLWGEVSGVRFRGKDPRGSP